MSEKLDLKLEIFIPCDLAKNTTKNREIFKEIAEFIKMYGGTTLVYNCKGYWKGKGLVEVDDITILRTYTTESFFKHYEHHISFYELIERIKQSLTQECIAFTINDVMEFY